MEVMIKEGRLDKLLQMLNEEFEILLTIKSPELRNIKELTSGDIILIKGLIREILPEYQKDSELKENEARYCASLDAFYKFFIQYH
jgi:hypothetical protein